MPVIFQYLLKLSVSLGVIYLFYLLVLRRLTFYHHNRWYLLGYSVLSFFIAFIDISPLLNKTEVAQSGIVTFIPVMGAWTAGVPAVVASTSPTGAWAVWKLAIALLVLGSIVLLLRLLFQWISFRKLTRKAQLIDDNDVKFYQVNENIIPFSFGRSIFVNQHLHTEAELKEIVRHEFVHVKQLHTVDIIWAEIICIVNWYNPFAWLIRRAVRQNLEFIADHQVIANGVDKKRYQYLLLKVIGNNHFSIVHNFNFSSLKNRIIMMNKLKSTPVHLTRFLFALPLLTILLVSFRQIVTETGLEKPLNTLVDTIPGKHIKEASALTSSFTMHRSDNMGKEHRAFFERNSDVNLLHWKKNGDIEVYRKNGKVVLYSMPYDLEKFKTKYGAPPQPGGSQPSSPLSPLNPPSLESAVPAPKLPNAEGLESTPDKYNVESPVQALDPPVKESPVPTPDAPVKESSRITIKTTIEKSNMGDPSARPLVLVDGEEWPEHLDFNSIDAANISSISVYKDGAATQRYGNKGKNGIIEITTKQHLITQSKGLDIYLKDANLSPAPLFYLDGKEVTIKTINLLDPQKIKSVDVLKGKAAEKYGEKGKNGVIEVWTRGS